MGYGAKPHVGALIARRALCLGRCRILRAACGPGARRPAQPLRYPPPCRQRAFERGCRGLRNPAACCALINLRRSRQRPWYGQRCWPAVQLPLHGLLPGLLGSSALGARAGTPAPAPVQVRHWRAA